LTPLPVVSRPANGRLGRFFDPADFADTAIWDVLAGSTVSIDGIFETGREVALSGNSSGISAVLPVLTVSAQAIPDGGVQGDDLEIQGVNYRVADIQPDGSGLTRVILERTLT
jgi:hypothetical protein